MSQVAGLPHHRIIVPAIGPLLQALLGKVSKGEFSKGISCSNSSHRRSVTLILPANVPSTLFGESLASPYAVNPSSHLHWAPPCTATIPTSHSNGLTRPRPHVSSGRSQQSEQKYPEYKQRTRCCCCCCLAPERRRTNRRQSSSSGPGIRSHQLLSIPRTIRATTACRYLLVHRATNVESVRASDSIVVGGGSQRGFPKAAERTERERALPPR